MSATNVYTVPDISCGHCRAAIEGELDKLDGVSQRSVNIEGKTVTVTGVASEDEITNAIREAGYEVTDVQHTGRGTDEGGGTVPSDFKPPA